MSLYLCHIYRYEIAKRSMNEQIASESESSKIIDTICSVRDIFHDSDSAPGKRNRVGILEIHSGNDEQASGNWRATFFKPDLSI